MKYYLPSKTKRILLGSVVILFTLLLLNNCFSYIITDEDIPLSGTTEVDASFYLFNPLGFTPTFTNVSPSMCEYIGEGTVSYSGAIYNDAASVEAAILEEPDYQEILQTYSTIEWSSLFNRKGNTIVIGTYSYISDEPYNSRSMAFDDEETDYSEDEDEYAEEILEDEEVDEEPQVGASLRSMKLQEIDTTPKLVELDKHSILNADKSDFSPNTEVKWDGFSNYAYKHDVNDGVIPVDLLDDPIYCSMNLPSEDMSEFSESTHRGNGHITNKLTPAQTTAVGIGATYLINGKTMSQDFTMCMGKMALYAFSKSQNKWVVVDEQNTCKGLQMYELPWTTHRHYPCTNITQYDDHVEIKIKKDELNGYAFHFWGVRKPIDQSDYLYYATAYQTWVKEDYASDILCTEGGIDAKDDAGKTGIQLISSRSITLTTEPKTVWCHTIPNSEYDHDRDYVQLTQLFNR